MSSFIPPSVPRVTCQKLTVCPVALKNRQLTLTSGWRHLDGTIDGHKEVVGVTSFYSSGFLDSCMEMADIKSTQTGL